MLCYYQSIDFFVHNVGDIMRVMISLFWKNKVRNSIYFYLKLIVEESQMLHVSFKETQVVL